MIPESDPAMPRNPPTPLALLARLCGMTLLEVSELTDTSHNAVRSWACGRRETPYSTLLQLAEQHRRIQEIAARTIAAQLERLDGTPADATALRLRLATSDHQAQALGYPNLAAQRAVLAHAAAALVLKNRSVAVAFQEPDPPAGGAQIPETQDPGTGT